MHRNMIIIENESDSRYTWFHKRRFINGEVNLPARIIILILCVSKPIIHSRHTEKCQPPSCNGQWLDGIGVDPTDPRKVNNRALQSAIFFMIATVIESFYYCGQLEHYYFRNIFITSFSQTREQFLSFWELRTRSMTYIFLERGVLLISLHYWSTHQYVARMKIL